MTHDDETLALIAAAYEAAAQTVADNGDPAATQALGTQLCCNGVDCGCHGATVEEYLLHLIRSLTPSDAQAALDRIIRQAKNEALEKVALRVAAHALGEDRHSCDRLEEKIRAMKEPEE